MMNAFRPCAHGLGDRGYDAHRHLRPPKLIRIGSAAGPFRLNSGEFSYDARCANRAAVSVFFSSIVTVIGPTPFGTGVITEATSHTGAKSTSPQSLPSTRLMPTSITAAPGRTISAVTNRGWPMAATRMSACRATSGRLRVRL